MFDRTHRLTVATPKDVTLVAVGNLEQLLPYGIRDDIVDARFRLAPANGDPITSLAVDLGNNMGTGRCEEIDFRSSTNFDSRKLTV